MTKEARIYNKERTASLMNGVRKTRQSHTKKKKLDHCLGTKVILK